MSRYKAYSEYRDSGIDWNEETPSHWTTSKIRYMFSFDKGLTITKENLQDDGIPCVNYGEVHSRYGFEVNPTLHSLKCVSEQYLEVSASSLLKKGDFVFADTSEDIDGSGNFTQLVSDDVTFAGYHTIIVRPHDRRSSRFYAYLFDSKELRTQIRHAVKGVKVFSITQAILRGIDIWLPTLQEREKIANFLDHETAKIDTLIAKQQELIKLLKEKRQAVISHAVTKGLNPNAPMRDSGVEWLGEVPAHWITGKCGYHFSFLSGFAFPSVGFSTDEENPKLLRGINVGVSSLKWNETVYWERKPGDGLDEFMLKDGDLVIGMDRPLISEGVRVAKVTSSDLPCLLLQRVALIRVDEELHVDYIFRFLSSGMFVAHFSPETTGVSVPHISPDQIKNFLIPLPPIEEQLEIVRYLKEKNSRIESLISEAESAIELMQERRTALISAAVTGKIDVRDWQPPSDAIAA